MVKVNLLGRTFMVELIKEVEDGGHALICIATPPSVLPDIFHDDIYDLLKLQKFIWYTDFVAFDTRGDNWAYSIKVYLSDALTIHPDMERVILVPFKVPSDGTLLVSGSYGETFPFQLPSGNYKLLFETRFLTEQEIVSSNRYNKLLEELKKDESEYWEEQKPELCLFTFVPTDEKITPEIIRGFELRQKLVLYDRARPAGFD